MAIVGKVINEKEGRINTRQGEVLADVVYDKDFFQIRTYAIGDKDRTNGSKQNIQLTRDKAIELKKLLDVFIDK